MYRKDTKVSIYAAFVISKPTLTNIAGVSYLFFQLSTVRL
jgi:hypothetical protein